MDKNTLKAVSGFWEATKGFRGLLTVALVFDVLSAIPWVGMIFSGLGYGTLWLWMKNKGMHPGFGGEMKQIIKKISSIAGEMIAGAVGFGIVPGITVWTYFVIAEHTTELAEKEEKQAEEARRNQEEAQKENREIEKRTKTSAYL